MKNLYVLFLFVFLALPKAYSYTYLPNIKCYDKSTYQAGRQNWDIDIDENGIVYFANSEGLLRYIYGEWILSKTDGQESVRSVLVDEDKVWCGGNNYGYFSQDDSSLFTYHKVGELKGTHIWDIISFADKIYFSSENKLITYNKKTEAIDEKLYKTGIWGLVEWKDELWAIQNGSLGVINGLDFEKKQYFSPSEQGEVRKMFVHQGCLYLVMFDGRIFTYDRKEISLLKTSHQLDNTALFTAISYNDNSICLGAISDGFIQLSNSNKILRTVDSQNGLIENSVLSMLVDHSGNVWLGLDYGVAKIAPQGAINTVFNNGATYFINSIDDIIYLATNKGLYASKKDCSFSLIPNSGGQVWRVRSIDEQLYACHTTGILKVSSNKVKSVFDKAGVMDIASFHKDDCAIISSYSGLLFADLKNGEFCDSYSLDLWGYSKILYDKENDCIWADKQSSGIVKLTLDNKHKVQHVEYPNIQNTFDTGHGVLFHDGIQLLEYSSGTFHSTEKQLFKTVGKGKIASLDVSEDGNSIAYIKDGKICLKLVLPDGNIYSYNNLLRSINNKLVKDFEFLKIQGSNLLIATDRGVLVFNMNHKMVYNMKSKPIISSVNILDEDGTKYNFFYPYNTKCIALSSGDKNVAFKFDTEKSTFDLVEYRYKLWPYDKEWSEWDATINEKFYTQLKGGDYQFHLQSRLNRNKEEETTLAFSIDKIWYQTSWIALPFLLFILLVFGITILTMHTRTRSKIKAERERTQRKVIEENMTMKSEQLLQYVEIISHKNGVLNEIREGLERMRNTEAQRLAQKICNEVNNEKKEFLFHKLFSEIHQDFIARITEKYPSLTSNEVRMLSFIRLNIDTREIANLMNISSSSVNANRYRLRKKINLDKNTDLNQYILKF